MTKIYVVIAKDLEYGYEWAACDWGSGECCADEDVSQEVFFDKAQAQRVRDSVNAHGTNYEVVLHEFEV